MTFLVVLPLQPVEAPAAVALVVVVGEQRSVVLPPLLLLLLALGGRDRVHDGRGGGSHGLAGLGLAERGLDAGLERMICMQYRVLSGGGTLYAPGRSCLLQVFQERRLP